MVKDFSLNSGERQTATQYMSIRADHRFRYEWADAIIPAGGRGLDLFCGVGYGTQLLGRTRKLTGIDGSAEAIALARRCYSGEHHDFLPMQWPFDIAPASLDFVVSLESIEHVSDGERFFAAMAEAVKPGGWMVYSTPNEDRLPLAAFGGGQHFHHRHYTHAQTIALAERNGLVLRAYAGQDVYLMEGRRPVGALNPDRMKLRENQPGQFTIAAAQRPA